LKKNSWVLKQDDVSTIELIEVHAINCMAPFILIRLLKPLMIQTPAKEKFVINVSAVEGQFYHRKTANHPHTNMAKAALNMMTRTSAAHLARSNIWINSVDTGWVSDMNPVPKAKSIAKRYKEQFRNPLDEVDGAARCLDPIFSRLNNGTLVYGKFLKDYVVAPW